MEIVRGQCICENSGRSVNPLTSYQLDMIVTFIVTVTWMIDLNFNRNNLLFKVNSSAKYKAQHSIIWWNIERNQLTLSGTVTLTFEQVKPMSIGVINWPMPIHMWNIKPIGHFVDELLIGNDYHTYCDSNLEIWHSDQNFNSGHLLSNANADGKYQTNRWISWRIIGRKRFHT